MQTAKLCYTPPKRVHVLMAKAVGATMWFWIFWRLKHDWRDFTVSIVKQHMTATDLQTRTWIKHLLF